MAITKTNFINYIRCPHFVALDHIKYEKLTSSMSYEEYELEEQEATVKELYGLMFDEDGEDKIDTVNEQMKIMLPFYNQVELLAGSLAHKYFDGTFIYSKKTSSQESFDAVINGIRYLCYVDIYNEGKDYNRVIEVKATTSNQYLSLGSKNKEKKITSIFQKGKDGIYYLLEDLRLPIEEYMDEKVYELERTKLFDKYTSSGHYVYDLAIQRYIIEHDLKSHGEEEKISRMKYYLAVLNHRYVFDGTYEGNIPRYYKNQSGEDVILYFDMTSVTKAMMDKIDLDRKKVESYIHNLEEIPYPIGNYCEKKKTTKCKYIPVCWNKIPNKNSIFSYLDNHYGFKDENGKKHTTFELANEGMVNLIDVPDSYLQRRKNQIQKEVVLTKKPYQDIDKIEKGMEQITYPIYHLDFETFPCPLPRYRGERPYTQSVFQFSLHIETSPGVCDKERDHYGYLAKDHKDCRLELISKLCEWIDTESGGTVLVYNESFEKSRLKELSEIFPEYKIQLLKIRDMVFDLMFVLRGNTKLYEKLGYEKEDCKLFNYYHPFMNGSFSIKKILPLFSDLTYEGMEVGNGTEAMITYASFPKLEPAIYEYKYQKLVEYCMQDTWAMVEILKGLRELVKEGNI